MSYHAPNPLQRDTFFAHRLMTEHPPVLRDPNKQVVLEVACPVGMVHEGEIGSSRWATMPLPERIALGHVDHFIEVREGVYDYAPTTGVAGAEKWHVNFADLRLFTAYGSGLFAAVGAVGWKLGAMPPSIGVRACDRHAPLAR